MERLRKDSSESRRSFLKSMAGAAGAMACGVGNSAAGATTRENEGIKPNFVFFLGEGVRSDEFRFAGNQIINTPTFDRIAGEGIVFRNTFCTHALCSPSRASILTGLYSHSTGVIDNHNHNIPDDIPTIADILRGAGYEVAMFGKVHVHGLSKRKWDRYFGIDQASTNYYHPLITESENGVVQGPQQFHGYFDDLVTAKALEWMNQKHEKPFCLFLWFMAPHAPFYRARRHADLYNGVRIPKPDTFDDDLKGYPGKPPAFSRGMNKIVTGAYANNDDARSLEELVKDHYAGVVATDENAGKVMDELEKLELLDETVVILSADHGFFLGEWGLYNKMLMHEPSIRVPLAVRYPRLIKPGSVCEQMALNVDVAATMLDLAGVKPAGWNSQGHSLVPLMKGNERLTWRTDWLYEFYDNRIASKNRGVRTNRYKLIHYWGEPEWFELYDLEVDPGERNNLWGMPEYSGLGKRLLARIEELRKETGDYSG